MKLLETTDRVLSKCFIKNFDAIENKDVRIQHGLVAGWISLCATISLFVVKMILGVMSGSISVIADAFHLLSHLANSIILIVSFWVASRPATTKTPFGHGRMEHVAPLLMSVFLFVSGIQIGERSVHQLLTPHPIHYWSALPWILALTILVKEWAGQLVRFLGKRVDSHAIMANAFHHRIDTVISLTVIGSLVAGKYFHLPEIDGFIGILVSAWLLYMGYNHAREAIIPILGKAPSKDMTNRVKEIATSIDGIKGVHEIIIHDYGSMYLISLHVEIPEKFSPAEMHEIAERCEGKLRTAYGGEVVCHTDPLVAKTPEVQAIENQFRMLVERFPTINDYHDFRVIAESPERIIIAADIDAADNVPETEFETLVSDLKIQVKNTLPNVAYCVFYVTPRFSY